MTDTTLLNSTEPLTMEALREHFLTHDFSSQTSAYKFLTASNEKNQLYIRAKEIFRTAWNQQLKPFSKKTSMVNLSPDAPIRCLEESEEKLVAGTVMEILGNEPLAEVLMDQVLTGMRGPMISEIEKYARRKGKSAQSLTEEEFQQALEAFADEFLSRMMALLLQVQEVPTLLDFMKHVPAEEDFDQNTRRNYQKIDFERRWNHSRTAVGEMLPLTQAMLDSTPGDLGSTATEAVDLGQIPVDSSQELYQNLLNAFISSLEDHTDQQIMQMRADGKTQKEIAATLGFADHSAVTKRLRKLRVQFEAFMNEI